MEILGRDDVKSVSPKLYQLIDWVQVADISQLRHTTKLMEALRLLLCFAIQQSEAGCGAKIESFIFQKL